MYDRCQERVHGTGRGPLGAPHLCPGLLVDGSHGKYRKYRRPTVAERLTLCRKVSVGTWDLFSRGSHAGPSHLDKTQVTLTAFLIRCQAPTKGYTSQKPERESQSSPWPWEEQVGSKGRQLGLRDSEQALLEAVPTQGDHRSRKGLRGLRVAEGWTGVKMWWPWRW